MTVLFQTFAISGQMSEPIHNLIRLGPETAAQFMLPAPATVSYKTVTGGATYTDTIAALTPAAVYPVPGSGATSTVDCTISRYVIFVFPVYNGPTRLYICDEGSFNFYAQQGYIIPLYYCYLHGWQVYQNTTGVATPPPGGSIIGGAYLGDHTSTYVTGSALFTMSSSVQAESMGYAIGFKLHALPSGTTKWSILAQQWGDGWMEVWLDSTGNISMGLFSSNGTTGGTMAVTSSPVPMDTWLWVAARWVGDRAANSLWHPLCAVWNKNGVVLASVEGTWDNTGNNAGDRSWTTGPISIGAKPSNANSGTVSPPADGSFVWSHLVCNVGSPGNDPGWYGPLLNNGSVGASFEVKMTEAPGTYSTLACGGGTIAPVSGGTLVVANANGPFVNSPAAYTTIRGNVGDAWGFFVKVPTAFPSVSTALLDLDLGFGGYSRIVLTPTGTILHEFAYSGRVFSYDLMHAVAIPLNQYVWITWGSSGNTGDNWDGVYVGKVIDQAGNVLGSVANASSQLGLSGGTYPTVINWGISASNYPTYHSVPMDGSILLSKLVHAVDSGGTDNPQALPRPSADRTGDFEDFNCRDGIGVQTTLHDNSPNHHDMTAGTQGCTVQVVGPYV